MSLSAKRESRSPIHGRDQRAGRLHKTRILDEFCATCGYHRKNDTAHCEHKNWTHMRQLLGYERFEHPELVPLLNDLYGRAWSQYQNHFRPTFKREKKKGKTVKTYEKKPQTPSPRLLASDAIPEANKARRREEPQRLDPFALKKNLEEKLKKFFPALGPLDRESTKT